MSNNDATASIHGGANSRAKRNSFVNGVIMKKIICILLLLSIFTTALISCKGVTVIEDQTETETETEAVTSEITEKSTADTNVETEPVDDGIDHSFDWQYDYDFDYDNGSVPGDYIFNDAMASGYTMLLKRNVHTGECTTVCTDPFCEHNSAACPFYNTYFVMGIGNTMYGIMHDDNNAKNILYSYNVETEKKEIIYETSASLTGYLQYKYYIYYRDSVKGIMRLDTETNETVSIKSQLGSTLHSASWGLLMWVRKNDDASLVFTATDLMGDDPRPYNPYIYEGKLHGISRTEGSTYSSVVELTRAGEIEKVLLEKTYDSIIVGDSMLYYGVTDEGPYKHDIYIAPIETFEARFLCHIEEAEPKSIGFSTNNLLLSGDWMAFVTKPNYPLTEDKIGIFSDMILVNMKTGEYHISRYIE